MKASLIKRFFAVMIDKLIFLIPLTILEIILVIIALTAVNSSEQATVISIGSVVITLITTGFLVLYFLIRDGIGGRSLGKRLLGLKIVKDDGGPCTMMTSITRNFTLVIPFVALIECVMVLIDPDGKRLGDKIAKTKVVNV